MKYLISLLFTINFLNASMFYSAKNICIEDFYTKFSSFYYLQSSNNTWYVTSSTKQAETILPNFTFDPVSSECRPNVSYILGMQETEYNFLLGIVGLIFGAVFMFFTTQIFSMVGGRR